MNDPQLDADLDLLQRYIDKQDEDHYVGSPHTLPLIFFGGLVGLGAFVLLVISP